MLPVEKLETLISNKGSHQVKVLALLSLFIPYLIIKIFKLKLDVFKVYLALIAASYIIYVSICILSYQAREHISFEEMYKHAKTGDLFFGKTDTSYDIPEFIYFRLYCALVSKSDWSHVGLIVRDPNTQKLYVWEAAEDPSYDHMTFKNMSGTKLSDLKEKVLEYHGYVGFRPLKKPLSEKVSNNVWNMCHEYKNLPFKSAAFSSKEKNCSESVREILERNKIFSLKNTLICTPGHFSFINPQTSEKWDKEYIVVK